ncbi:unnamed protein product [Owenia fusiformis]|uniref:Uncharacterized protein n=1 Tax=Owenia fusiformis TaxID=6347 RepID=A0A8S4PZF9_OWEFU|nr:unnamed protein product [Owenia fusiformis]
MATQQVPMGPISTKEDCKKYLSQKQIPQMFESILAALMLERPEDHIKFIETKIEKIKEIGPENVNWESFVYDLHPYRDQTRLDHINDNSKYQKEYQKRGEERNVKSGMQSGRSSRDSGLMSKTPGGEYEPELFELTETNTSAKT